MIDANLRVREMKLFSHIVKDDLGVAPNPFHGYCTTALCTPSGHRFERGGLKSKCKIECLGLAKLKASGFIISICTSK